LPYEQLVTRRTALSSK